MSDLFMGTGYVSTVNNSENVKVFENEMFGNVRTVYIDGKIYFCGKDAAECLGYTNPQKAIRDHCKGVNEMFIPSNGGMQKTKFIPEGDIYRLIVRSKLPQAEKFESWIFDDVIPQIRATGSYCNGVPQTYSQALMQAAILAQKAEEQEKKIKELAPKAQFHDDVECSKNALLIRDFAKILNNNEGIKEWTERKIFKYLRKAGYLMDKPKTSQHNRPYAKFMKYFDVKESTFTSKDGETFVTCSPRINGKGQIYFTNLFKKVHIDCLN